MQNDLLVQDTEPSLVVAEDPAIICHVRPFHLSARERPVPKFEPTPTQNRLLTQETALR